VATNDVYLVTVSGKNPGGITQNTLAFIRTDNGEPVVADFLALAVDIKAIHLTFQASAYNYVGWKARQIRGTGVTWPTSNDCNPTGGRIEEGLFSSGTSGTDNGQLLPPQCAMVTTLKTGIAGRRHRGRFYAGGWSENAQDAGTWATTQLNSVTSGWTTFLTNYGVLAPLSGFKLGIWSYRTASGCEVDPISHKHTKVEPGKPAEAFTPVNAFTVRPTVYSQRKRVAGVGL